MPEVELDVIPSHKILALANICLHDAPQAGLAVILILLEIYGLRQRQAILVFHAEETHDSHGIRQ
jgi:hypothetical protein